ncbi:MAG: SMC family ATPase [Pyrobaculum sp.]|uniref:SMC family ATPase n=1 Tax=Pyrobaculum sp. TaxID=2004705 RepID=UPI0031815C3A
MIRRVELINFKAHAKAAFRFGEGVNFIYGPNGSGKTSLMEAISVALFGSTWVRKVGSKWSDYLRRGSTAGEVRLYLSYQGGEVVIARRFGESGTSPSGTYMAVNGSIIARGDADVTAAVATKLGIGVEEFRHLLYIRQGELRRILQEAEYLDRILRLDEFDKVDELYRDVYNELRARRERIGGRAEELEKRIQPLRSRLEDLRRRLGEVEAKLRELEPYQNRLPEAERRYLELRDRHNVLLAEREQLERRLEELAHAALEAEKDVEQLEEELEKIRKAAQELKTLPTFGDVEKEYFELRQVVSVVEKIPLEVKSYDPSRLEEARQRLEDSSRRLAQVKSRLELLRDVVRLASRAEGGVCPVCGSPLRPEAVRRHELEIIGLEKEEKRLVSLIEELRDEIKRLESLDRAYQTYREYLNVDLLSAKKRLTELEKMYKAKVETERRRAYLAALVEREAEVLGKLEKAKRRLAEAEVAIGEVGERLKKVEEELEKTQALLKEAEAEYLLTRDRHREYTALQTLAKELREQLQSTELELQEAVAELEKAREDLSKLDKALAVAKNVRGTLAELKPAARQIFLRAINEELNHVFLKLRHKDAFKSAQLVEANGRYVARISTPNGYIDHGLLSLGEQNLLALSLRVALARALLGGAPFMMLDEPTEHLDEEHRKRIVELVRDLTSVVPTVVVTSHLGEFEEVADNIIHL